MRKILAVIASICSLGAAGQFAQAAAAQAATTSNAMTGQASEAAAAVDIADQAAHRRGGKVQIAVLGTTHLSEAPETVARSALFDPLVARLADFKPDLVAIESLSARTHTWAIRPKT